jgi:hypothetical protein
MRLQISGDRAIKDVQGDFTAAYPFLKIEFFKNGIVRKDRYHLTRLIPHTHNIKDAWFIKKQEGDIEITDGMTVLELENLLINRFGLSAQVFRRSGSLWLETTLTDKWTLKQQNDHGREISTEKKKPEREEYDYD